MNEEYKRSQWAFSQEKQGVPESSSSILTHDIFCVKSRALFNYISNNLLAADLKWSLFCAACNSYRFDTVLKPFPSFFLLQDDIKQIDKLREVIGMCPSMKNVLKQLKDNSLPTILKDLLHWVLIYLSEPNFKYIVKEELQEIASQVSSEITTTMPDYIFSVICNRKSQQKFSLTALNYSTKLAFHGSRLDNFYSIINYGLQVSFNKVSAFGPGIYLSKQMMVSLPYSPRGFTWSYSCFGSHISVVALCEVIDHPDVKSEFNSRKNIFEDPDNRSAKGKYLIVRNSDLVCIRYLLVYSSDDFESALLMQSPTIIGWIKRHKMFTFILGYIILLLGIGSSNSPLLYKFYKKLLSRFDGGNE